ncbi:16S rRNA (cytosine(967)-C(5))-methyltransferase RsmB [Halorhodospira halophila]|uniref:16S rRNA (cytosine(967)-C(5))-methyltransferase n=1 Tax=Halorhodospira halophila (strain DSM 244 / SL1) TaxID=349124 RepID=A1WZH2_HALHL|nr:16S rRNA (cytosine(967)-C(5))-methyltransferase RsmB [Halorhodospira halophila]ABM63084.1 16S rRNA m(5)C-967 methyltransferase [Halorhodospira halophila SL1]MBK1727794.1 16S rRNA (cytosine(967)-C(5))-methyltransferase RsmB [Halorhodospira halophila]
MSTPPRVAAVHVLERVLERGETLDEALEAQFSRVSERNRSLLQALVYGALRWLTRLEAQVATLTPRDDWRADPLLRGLLVIGAWEAQGLATPAHAAVSEAVDAARRLRRARAAGMVNAVLRKLHKATPPGPADEAARYALPPWLLDHLRRAWPEDWPAVAEAGNAHPPMTLRFDRNRISREACLQSLAEQEIPAHPGEVAPSAATLHAPVPVARLPGFAEGWLSVQDEAAQLAAPLLDPQPGDRVLDACAAPGGKTLHLLEHTPTAAVTALDRSSRRLRQVRDNLARGGYEAQCLAADAADPEAWWDGEPFQRILLDAPCTGSGVIRRHPDIKWLRGVDDPARMAAAQRHLLAALWRVLAPGGRLLYATCSIFPEENEQVVAGFLAEHADAKPGPLAPVGRCTGSGCQILPGEHGMDGFFYACLERSAA